MKIRTSFVANSSSSSFIIGVKNIEQFDTSSLPKWSVRLFNKIINMITRDSEKFKSKEEVDNYFIYNYGYDITSIQQILEDDEYVKQKYDKYISAIESGHNIYEVSIDNNDESTAELFYSLSEKDDESGIYLILNEG